MHKATFLTLFGAWALGMAAPAPAQEPDDPATTETAGDEATGSETTAEAAAEKYPEHTFRLYSRRDVDFRGRPDVGLRVPLTEPIFSPRTADFYGRERTRDWPQSSVAVALTLLSTDGERQSAKAQEFRDFDGDAALGIDAQYRGDDFWLRLTGRHLLLDDQDARLELRRVGVLAAYLDYNQIPHNYAFGARSLYSGVGTGTLSIPDEIQQSLQSSTSPVDGAERLRGFVAEASSPVDLGHRRDRLAFKLDLTAFDPLAVELVVKHEKRKGTRPWSGSFGLSNVVEIPWPVDYDARDVTLSAEYKKGKTLVSGQYRYSEFENDFDTVTFDNPWRFTDSGPGSSIVSTFENGPSRGLIDLYPNNDQHEVTLTLIRNQLPGESNLVVTLSRGRLEQNDTLQPYTINPAIVPGPPANAPFDASDPANRPAASAQAELDTRLVHVRWTSRPTHLVSINAHFRDFELDNETAQIFIPGFAPEDAFWLSFGTPEGRYTNLPIAQSQSELGLELAFHLGRENRLTLGYERDDVDREFREVEKSTEDRFEVSFDAKPAPWVDFKASYLVGTREAEEYDFAQFFRNQGIDFIPVLSFLRKFDQADRDRDRLQVMANFYATESLTLGAHVIVGEDDYPHSRFGVLDDEHEIYAADLTWAASERLSLFASYSFERYDVAIAGREWIPFGPGDPYRTEPGLESASNWSADTTDEIASVAFGLDVELVPEKLSLDVSYTYSKSDGQIAYASPIGEVDLNPYEPADFAQVDDVTWYNLNPELEYTIGERFRLKLAYVRERYEILDFNNEGFELVPVTPEGEFNGGLFMGTLPTDFDLDVVYLTLGIEF